VIKWIVIGLLVAGTFGVIWTAPWKDDVDRLTDQVQQKFDAARATLDVLDGATSGDCKAVGAAAPGNVTQAVETIAAEAKRNPDAPVPGISGESSSTVAEVAKRQAALIAECAKRLPRTGAGWVDLQKKLELAAQGG
jgi:hypothetical protein